jgi:hypothetical protein
MRGVLVGVGRLGTVVGAVFIFGIILLVQLSKNQWKANNDEFDRQCLDIANELQGSLAMTTKGPPLLFSIRQLTVGAPV